MEVVSQLFCALDVGYIAQVEFDQLADDADELAGKIVALSKSLGRNSQIARPSTPAPSASAASTLDPRLPYDLRLSTSHPFRFSASCFANLTRSQFTDKIFE